MLRVTLEIFPGGVAARRKLIGQLDISNMTNLTEISDYQWTLHGEIPEALARGHVYGFDRVRNGAWDLVHLVLSKAKAKLGGRVGR